jgi:hypothetical protein
VFVEKACAKKPTWIEVVDGFAVSLVALAMPLNTLTVSGAVAPTVIATYFSHVSLRVGFRTNNLRANCGV